MEVSQVLPVFAIAMYAVILTRCICEDEHTTSDRRQNGVGEKVMMGYSSSWAIELNGGQDEADRLADKYGFVNLGQVSCERDIAIAVHIIMCR